MHLSVCKIKWSSSSTSAGDWPPQQNNASLLLKNKRRKHPAATLTTVRSSTPQQPWVVYRNLNQQPTVHAAPKGKALLEWYFTSTTYSTRWMLKQLMWAISSIVITLLKKKKKDQRTKIQYDGSTYHRNQEEMTWPWKSSKHKGVINCLQTNMHYNIICLKLVC